MELETVPAAIRDCVQWLACYIYIFQLQTEPIRDTRFLKNNASACIEENMTPKHPPA
jgi:hypothetical protein